MRDFFKYVLASCVALLLVTGIGLTLVIGLLTAIAVSGDDDDSDVEPNSILTLDLSIPITDTPPVVTPDKVIGDLVAGRSVTPPISLRTTLDALEAAANDDRIVGLYIEGAGASGLATLREVRQGIEAFKTADKPVIAYDMAWNERSYYLVSVADKIMLNPSGRMELNGFSSESMFFAGALEKYGIGVSAIRAGQYKSAIEPFTRSDRSPEEKAQTQELLGQLWQEFIDTTTTSRGFSSGKIQSIADSQGLLLPEEALASGLVDQVAHDDEVIRQLQELTGEDIDETSFRNVNLSIYADEVNGEQNPIGFTATPKIAVVYAEGNIVNGEGELGQIGGDRFAQIFREIRLDEDINAVVLRVNSPGGSAAAAEKIAREIELIAGDKPVIVSMGNLAASGGYLIATHGDTIFASPNTITGSIGVFGLFPNFQGLANRNGITWDVVKTGEYADIGTVSRPPTEAESAIAQRFVDQVYDNFLQAVADSRPLSRAELEPIAQGRVWSGINAQSIGLVDQIGGLEDAIAAAATAADLGETWDLEEYPKSLNFEEELLRQLFSSRVRSRLGQTFLSSSMTPSSEAAWPSPTTAYPVTDDPITAQWQRAKIELDMLRSLNDPQDVYTRLPINYIID